MPWDQSSKSKSAPLETFVPDPKTVVSKPLVFVVVEWVSQ